MDKLSKSLEALKFLSTTTTTTTTPAESLTASNEKSRSDPISLSKEKIFHLNNITDLLSSPTLIKGNNENYFKLLTASIETLFTSCDDTDHDVRLAAEDNINKLVKNLKETHLARIQVELHRIIKRNPNVGPRALKGALWRFAELANLLHAKKIRPFFEHLFNSFCTIANRSEDIVHDKLPDYYELIFRILGRSINDKEIKELFLSYLTNMSNESALIRRSSASCIIIFCCYSRYPMVNARFLITYAIDQLLEYHHQSEYLRLINGYLGLIKNLIQLLGTHIDEFLFLSSTMQTPLNTNKTLDINEQYLPINLRQIIECMDIVCYLCLQHFDHNIVSSSLETLEILLKYSNLFDFDQLLISTDNQSIEQTRVYIKLKSFNMNYQRSFIENIQQQFINEENNSISTINNNDKRTSAAKLVEQLTSKYILNSDGSIKSNDESRISIKGATITCLSYLATIDPFAFFDSFDYPTEIITYLLSLREHSDPHLRGACANLLAKLIQTTVRLLIISPTNSFNSQSFLLSIDSQESSRLDLQLGILNDLLLTYRLCLNDSNARVTHISLNALRTLLPILLLNNQALTRIALELLDDAIQHSTSTYVLTKVALAQLIGDIDFRILSYLEQQQAKKTNRSWLDRCIDIIFLFLSDDDSRVRQVAATTFAKFVEHSSFLPVQWPIHFLLKWIHSSCQWIYQIHHSFQQFNIPTKEFFNENISCLSRLIFDRLAQASTRTQIIGCFEGILALVHTLNSNTIHSFFHHQYDELRLLIHFFKHPFILHDLSNLQLLLEIIHELFSKLTINSSTDGIDVQVIEKVFHFLIKILSIFSCVIEDTTPPIPPTSKLTFPSIPSSPNQSKKRTETTTNNNDTLNSKDSIQSDGLNSPKDSSIIEKKPIRTQLGAFGNNPSMMKLFDLIRLSYQIHRSLLNSSEIDRFSQLLSITLDSLKSILKLVSINDISKHLDETLGYLKSTFSIEKIQTIQCTQEFLQNLYQLVLVSQTSVERQSSSINIFQSSTNIHTITIRQPMIYLFGSAHTQSMSSDQSIETSSIRDFYLTIKQRQTVEHLKHPPNRTERTKIGNYIRSFESIVILSLKKYVNSNETDFHAAVLDLLVQLLLLRVNYSLLDSDEHFLNHIINQLELIEDMKSGFIGTPFFIYRIAEFLMMLSHDTLHSKQVIKIQDLIKHCDALYASGHEPETHALSALEPVVYDLFLVRSRTDNKELEAQRMVIIQTLLKLIRYNKALQLLIVIVDSVRIEVDKWKRLSRQIIDVILIQLESNVSFESFKEENSLEIYATELTLFDVVSTVALRPIDPFINAFRLLTNRSNINRHTINRWLMHINLLLRCLVQNSMEDAILARWQDVSSSGMNTHEESFSGVLLRILHDLVQRLLTYTRQSRGDIDRTFVYLLSDYLYLLIYILENAKQFRTIVHDFRQLLIDNETDETVHRLDTFSYLNQLSEYFKILSSFSISLLLQWTHILNILDYTQESWWSSMLTISIPSSLVTHLSLSGQLQSYCDLICRHDLYVEHLTSILTHRYLLYLLFEQSDTCSYIHNLFGLIHRTSITSHLFVESIYTNWDYLLKQNQLLLPLKILRCLEGIHIDESGLVLVLLIEQFLILPYLAILRLAELILCRRIELMLTFDEHILENQLMPKYLPLILQNLIKQNQFNRNKHDFKMNEHLYGLIQRLITKIHFNSILTIDFNKQDTFLNDIYSSNDEDFILNWIKQVHCPIDITPKIYAQMLKNVAYKKLLPFMMSQEFLWLAMPDCLQLGISIPSVWRASTGALIKKINDLCFSLPTQRLISNEINLTDDESTPDLIYIKSLLSCSINQTYLIALIDSISIYFQTIQTHIDLTCQFSPGDNRDLLRFLIFISELIYLNFHYQKQIYFNWNLIECFCHCLIQTITNSTSNLYQLLIASDQIISCCILAKSIHSIYEYLFQRHAIVYQIKTKQDYFNLIEPDNRPYTQILIQTFHDLNHLYNLIKQIHFIPSFYRKYLYKIAIILFRLPIFNSFIRIPTQFWEQNQFDFKLQFHSIDYCLSTFPIDLLQHSDIMTDYIERISLVGWLSRTQFQEIWVTFLSAINPGRNEDSEQISRDENLEMNAMQCVWIRGVTTFLLNALRLNSIGNPADRTFEHCCRNRTIPFLSTDLGGKYIQTCSIMGISPKRILTNLERLSTDDFLFYGQLSFDTILTSIQSNNASPLPVNSLFDRLFSRYGLDLNSSLQILIELYVRWLTQNPNQLCLQLKFELIRSFIYLSDLFTSTQQLTNLFDLCLDYSRTWFEEDDLIMSLISYGLCKSGILLGQITKEYNEIYLRIIERSWKFLSKTIGYSSCLFLLESHEDDINKIILPNLIQELNHDIQNNLLKTNLDVRLNGLILATIFYLIENNQMNSFEIINSLLKDDYLDPNDALTQQIISIGLERLLLLGQYPKNEIWRLYKRSITSLRQSTGLNLDQLILILTRIYTNENIQTTNIEYLHDEQEMLDSLTMNSSSDNILIELVGELYERTKQTYILPYEAILLLRPLPSLLAHMGISDRLMNKIVVEFAASTQQLYPQILAYIVFAVFRILISSHYSAKVNEWTLLSMTSVAQRKPIRMAIWGLTCLMLSACSLHTIADTLFPLALSRFSARFEELDNRLFLLAGREYYHQLNNVEQRRQFEQAFINESTTEKIYADLLAHLRDTISSSS